MATDIIVQMVKIPVTNVEVSAKFYTEVSVLEEEFVVGEHGCSHLASFNPIMSVDINGLSAYAV